MKILWKYTRYKRKLIWLTILLLLFWLKSASFASEEDRVPELPTQKGSLQIQITYQDDNKEEFAVSGSKCSVTKVADLTVNGGSADYTWDSEFSVIGKEIAGMTAQESNEIAESLEKMILSGTAAHSYACETDENGKSSTLDNLEPGMYLVYGFNKPQTKDGTARISPYLTQVPQIIKDSDNKNVWSMDVLSYPKVIVVEQNEVNLQIVKRVKDKSGKDVATKETFWFSIYTDAEHTELLEEIDTNPVAVDMKGFSIQVQDVMIHNTIERENPLTLYVVEVNKDGSPLDTKAVYGPVYDEHATVTFSDMTSKTVTIVNKEGWAEAETDDDDDDNKNHNSSGSGGTSGGSSGPKTGDDTQIALFVILIFASFIGIAGTIRRKINKS